ncbi:MAG: hypothetical protein IRZ28_11235 [Steroidobacteraceae bacterium]|nr:hypothetical protein [Steroidobacteraceae bacterium]
MARPWEQVTMHELARRAKAGDAAAALQLARLMLDQADPPDGLPAFIRRAPGIGGHLTPELFDVLADAWDAAVAEREIRGLPETA